MEVEKQEQELKQQGDDESQGEDERARMAARGCIIIASR